MRKNDLKFDGLFFNQLSVSKYSGVNLNNKNRAHEEIKLYLKSANKAYYDMTALLRSKLLSRKTKEKSCTIQLTPVATYGCIKGSRQEEIALNFLFSRGKKF